MLPSVEWAAKEYDGQIKVVKVEADSNKDLVEKFKVSLGFVGLCAVRLQPLQHRSQHCPPSNTRRTEGADSSVVAHCYPGSRDALCDHKQPELRL